ncbi:MAG: ABC transporter substrate-binding protein [Pseudomonadota bacterium]
MTFRMSGKGFLAATIGLALIGSTSALAQVKDVPRERTFIHEGWSQGSPTLKTPRNANYYNLAGEYRNGHMHNFEPLFYFNSITGDLVPWLGESFEMNDDFTEVTVKVRDGAKWADGEDFDAEDVAYTINMLVENGNGPANMRKAKEVANQVVGAEVVDKLTAKITLNAPDPRYPFRQLVNYYGHGLVWVPEHIWSGIEDKAAFTWYDDEKGYPVGTGAWKTVFASPEQIVLDRRDDWWGAETGFRDLPGPERVVAIGIGDNARRSDMILNAEADSTQLVTALDLLESVLKKSDAVTTYTGKDQPYAYQDWWPHSLYFNHLIEDSPFADVRVRRAVRYAIDKDQLIDFAWGGGNTPNDWPYPHYTPLVWYMDQAKDIVAKHEAGEFNLDKSAALMEEAGYSRNSDGMWEKDGKCAGGPLEVHQVLAAVGQVVVQQLKNAGFCAEYSQTPESFDNFRKGESLWHIFGHNGGSVFDPVDTMRMYITKNRTPIGTSTMFVSRWAHPEFDKIYDKMAAIPPENRDELLPLFRDAYDIWFAEAVEVPLELGYHTIPMNTTYWTNFPTKDNPYTLACIPCFISGAGTEVLHGVQPVN